MTLIKVFIHHRVIDSQSFVARIASHFHALTEPASRGELRAMHGAGSDAAHAALPLWVAIHGLRLRQGPGWAVQGAVGQVGRAAGAVGTARQLGVLIWEEVCHSYTKAADAGDVVVGKRKSPKGYVSNEHQRQ